MLDLPYLTALYGRLGRPGLREALLANEMGLLTYEDTVSFALPPPYEGEVSLRPATNDLFTFDEVFVSNVYGPISAYVSNARTVIDLGANIGLTSLYFLHHHPNCRILAIEPDVRNCGLLRENLSQHSVAGRVRVMHAAFWKVDGKAVFEPSHLQNEVNKGAVRSVSPGEEPRAETVVDCFCMESLLARSGFNEIDLLKVDIEGGEEHLFCGDFNWLSKVRCIAIEFHGFSRRLSEFDHAVAAKGFVVSEANDHTVIATKRATAGI
jgi:FkbM family methyltransferase